MATELEIKLTVSEPAQKQALQWLLALPGAREAGQKTLLNRYYDTPEAALNKARAALRVRQADDRYIQTLKTRGEFVHGAHNRQEWEWDLGRPELDLSLLAQTPLDERIDLDGLRLAFETDFQRQVVMLESGESLIEVAVDSGHVAGGGLSRPLHEVEFELKSGDPGSLMAEARKLAADVPVFLNLVSKAEQGYFLAGVYQPALSVEETPLSITGFLHLLSVAWLTGEEPALNEAALQQADRSVSQAGLESIWLPARQLLLSGGSVERLLAENPRFGELQLAIASLG